ncbi:uncharacterized protein LOC142234183 [Haematobia irritans]|uniref:uncharacterized protein LOC142234183 n=1 Tax=Haematobia irritans TaxID=7368 RepID=UPI003F5056EA
MSNRNRRANMNAQRPEIGRSTADQDNERERCYLSSTDHGDAGISQSEIFLRMQSLESLVRTLSERTPTRATNHSHMNIDCIPYFEPGMVNMSATMWIQKIDQIGELNGWDERSKIFALQNKLKGLARSWFENLQSYVSTWTEWKNLVIQSFPDYRDFAENLKRFVNRVKQPDETMANYYFEKKMLADVCKISGSDAVSCIIDGLPKGSLQIGARAGRFVSPEDLFGHYLSTFPSTSEPPSKARKIEGRSITIVGDAKEIICYNCKTKGHYASKCKLPTKKCDQCKKWGHLSRDCLKKNDSSRGRE